MIAESGPVSGRTPVAVRGDASHGCPARVSRGTIAPSPRACELGNHGAEEPMNLSPRAGVQALVVALGVLLMAEHAHSQ